MSSIHSAGWLGLLLMLAACSVACAQDPATSGPPTPDLPTTDLPTVATLTRLLPAETEIHLRLLEAVASNTHKHGDRFKLEVADPVIVDGQVLIPAGTACVGEVVHAAKAGFGGKAGELILASRFVRLGDREVKLRSFSASNGHDRVNLALGLSFVLVGLFVEGNNIALPEGTDVFARIAADSELAVVPSVPTQETDNNENPQH
jgi:hypothetical protein